MPEHYCKNCKNDGDNICQFTGARHDTGITCPSFEPKEKETEMFKIGDRVKVIANKERLAEICIARHALTGVEGVIERVGGTRVTTSIQVDFGDEYEGTWWLETQDLELVEEPPKEGEIRKFSSGATRDTADGKLDYIKALSPIVLRRYVQYLDKHRLQPDGSYRSFDNWKKGMDQGVYHSSGGRHFFDTWLLTEGYATEDNHGPVEIEDAICAQLFNLMGRLHEMLKDKVGLNFPAHRDRNTPTPGGY